MLRDRVLYLLQGLTVKHGRAFAKESTKRRMLGEDGKRPGQKSIGRVERKMAKEGRLKRTRLYPGGVDACGKRWRLPGRYDCSKGLVIVEILSRQVARANARAARKLAKQQRKPARPPRPSERPHRAAPTSAAAVVRLVDDEQRAANAAAAGELLRILGPPNRQT